MPFTVPRTISYMQCMMQDANAMGKPLKTGFFREWELIGGAFCARSLIPSFKEYKDLNRFGRTLWLIIC